MQVMKFNKDTLKTRSRETSLINHWILQMLFKFQLSVEGLWLGHHVVSLDKVFVPHFPSPPSMLMFTWKALRGGHKNATGAGGGGGGVLYCCIQTSLFNHLSPRLQNFHSQLSKVTKLNNKWKQLCNKELYFALWTLDTFWMFTGRT